MSQALSVHIGVTENDFGADPTPACAADAALMAVLSAERDFTVTDTLVGANATLAQSRKAILAAASRLKRGDLFLLTFSGHGIAVTDAAGQFLQAWVFQDQLLVRDGEASLDTILSSFEPGVRILIVVNACFTGRRDDDDTNPRILTLPLRAARRVVARDGRQFSLYSGEAPRLSAKARIESRVFAEGASIIEINASASDQIALAGADAQDPSPFVRLFDTVVREDQHTTFDTFIAELQVRSSQNHMPEMTPFPPRDPAFENLGPLRIR